MSIKSEQSQGWQKAAIALVSSVALFLLAWTFNTVQDLFAFAKESRVEMTQIRADITHLRVSLREMTPLTLHESETMELARRLHAAEDKMDRVVRVESDAAHLAEKIKSLEDQIRSIQLALGLRSKN